MKNKEEDEEEGLNLRCDTRFQNAFTICGWVFKVSTLVSAKQRTYFENAAACFKNTLKTRVATQLKRIEENFERKTFLGCLRKWLIG